MNFETWWQVKPFKDFSKSEWNEIAKKFSLLIWKASRENQQEYQKNEFCIADVCAYVDISTGCPALPENCKRTAKEFHHWLKENNYKIVKDE